MSQALDHATLYFGALAAQERADQENAKNEDYSTYLMFATAAEALREAAEATPPVEGTWDDEAVMYAKWAREKA